MKTKVTNEMVGELIGKMAEEVRSEMDKEFRIAYSQMGIAENDLIESLNAEQLKLYNDYKAKKEAFYQIASELYKRKF